MAGNLILLGDKTSHGGTVIEASGESAVGGVRIARVGRDRAIRIRRPPEQHKAGLIPKVYHESDDPNRLVPLVWRPEDYLICVTGDLTRNSIYIFAHNGVLGFPTCKKIQLPKAWEQLRAEVKK